MKYRKKPVVVEAVQMMEDMSLPEGVTRATNARDEFAIKTLEGTMHGNSGDWLITGVKGEKYFCKDDIFRMTYEEVKEGEG